MSNAENSILGAQADVLRRIIEGLKSQLADVIKVRDEQRSALMAQTAEIRDIKSQRAGLAQKCAELRGMLAKALIRAENHQSSVLEGLAARLEKLEETVGGIASYSGYTDFVAGTAAGGQAPSMDLHEPLTHQQKEDWEAYYNNIGKVGGAGGFLIDSGAPLPPKHERDVCDPAPPQDPL